MDCITTSADPSPEEEEEEEEERFLHNNDDDDDDVPLEVILQSLEIELPVTGSHNLKPAQDIEIMDIESESGVIPQNILPTGFKLRRSGRFSNQARVFYDYDSARDEGHSSSEEDKSEEEGSEENQEDENEEYKDALEQ